jgi:hypothetical protein
MFSRETTRFPTAPKGGRDRSSRRALEGCGVRTLEEGLVRRVATTQCFHVKRRGSLPGLSADATARADGPRGLRRPDAGGRAGAPRCEDSMFSREPKVRASVTSTLSMTDACENRPLYADTRRRA